MEKDVDPNKLSNRAAELFKQGYNCAESILIAFSEEMRVENSLIPRIATGFGGGMGGRGSICGALSGGIMVIGLRYGRNEVASKDKLNQAYNLTLRFYEEFEKSMGTVLCFDLTGIDLSTPEGRRKLVTSGFRQERCLPIVEKSALILAKLFQEEKD